MKNDHIFSLMAEKNITATELSEKTGISTGNISDWKSGRSSPKIDALIKISEVLDVSVDYLLGKEETKTLDEQLSEIDFALFGEIRDLTDEEKQKIIDFAKFTKSLRDKK